MLWENMTDVKLEGITLYIWQKFVNIKPTELELKENWTRTKQVQYKNWTRTEL